MDTGEIVRLERYLRDRFGQKINVSRKRRNDGSVEVTLGDEFIATIYRDEEDGEVSYQFTMAILEEDLPDAAVGRMNRPGR